MYLTFMGATGTVTGSKYLLEDEGYKLMIDCGLFQGLKELRERNWSGLPINPADVDDMILTHAHIDHSGYIPKFIKQGFKGKVYASLATTELCDILLPDSGNIQEEDARRANKYGYSRHHPAEPLYTMEEAWEAMEAFKPVAFGQKYALNDMLNFSFSRAGHILGAASVRIDDGSTSIVFSGDIGRMNDPMMVKPVGHQEADYLVLESTYGDRDHDPEDPSIKLAEIINRTVARGGVVLIPAFAVGRAQILLYYLHQLKEANAIPDVPIFLDSPMAIDATQLWKKHHVDHRLSEKQCDEIFKIAKYMRTPEQSKSLNEMNNMPRIIISASGMAEGGRVLHHMKNYCGDPKNTMLFAGFQAAGTRGANLTSGDTEVKIHGFTFPVRAEVDNLSGLSAHADRNEILKWLSSFTKPPRKVFLTHGEPEAALGLKAAIEERYGWNVVIPEYLQREEL